MGCNCKSGGIENTENIKNFSELTFKEKFHSFLTYTAKVIGFIFSLILLPFIMCAVVWFMFNTIVLTKEFEIKKIVFSLMGNSLTKKNEDDDEDDDDDDENLTEDDVVMLDVEEITHNVK